MSREAADRYFHTVTSPDGQSYTAAGLPAEIAAEPQVDGSVQLRRQNQAPADWARPVQSAQEFTEREFRLPEPGFVTLRVENEARGIIESYGCFAWLSSEKFDEQTKTTLVEAFGNSGRGLPVSFPDDGVHALLLLNNGLIPPNIFKKDEDAEHRKFTPSSCIAREVLQQIFTGRDLQNYFTGTEPLATPAAKPAEPEQPAPPLQVTAPAEQQLVRPALRDMSETGYIESLYKAEVRSRVDEHMAKRTGQLRGNLPLPLAPVAAPQPEEIVVSPKPKLQPESEPEVGPATAAAEVAAAAEPNFVYIDELDDDYEPPAEASDETAPGIPRVTEYRSAGRLPKELPDVFSQALQRAGRLPGADIVKRHKVMSGVVAAALVLGAMGLGGNHHSTPDATATTAITDGHHTGGTATAAWTPPTTPVALGAFNVTDKLQLSIPFTENNQTGWFPQVAPANVAQYYVSDTSSWQVTANEAAPGLVSIEGSKAVVDLAKVALQYTAIPMTQAEINQQATCTASVGGQQKTWRPRIIDRNGFVSCAAPIKVADLTKAIKAGTQMPITPAQATEINKNLSTLAANDAVNFDALNQLAAALNIDRTQLKNFSDALKQQLSKDVSAATQRPVTFIHQVPSGATSYLNLIDKQQGPTTQDSLQIQGITGALTDYANATVTKK